MTQHFITEKIPVKSYHGQSKWVKFSRGPVYREIINLNQEPDVDEEGFQTVKGRGKKSQNIYCWYLQHHNLFKVEKDSNHKKTDKNLTDQIEKKLYFCDPDYQIYQNDNQPQYATDPNHPNELVPLICYAKWNQIKFKPTTFIAQNAAQIKQTLEHLKYCVVIEKDHQLILVEE